MLDAHQGPRHMGCTKGLGQVLSLNRPGLGEEPALHQTRSDSFTVFSFPKPANSLTLDQARSLTQ